MGVLEVEAIDVASAGVGTVNREGSGPRTGQDRPQLPTPEKCPSSLLRVPDSVV